MKKLLAILLSLIIISSVIAVEAVVKGNISPDGAEIQVDFPVPLMQANKGGSDGAGLCVFTSASMASIFHNIEVLQDFRDWMTKYNGGGWPEKFDKMVKQICKERDVPIPEYIQIEGKSEMIPVLRAALNAGFMPCITYDHSLTGRYGGKRIAHMCNLVHLDDKWAAILDNNYVGENKYEWIETTKLVEVICGRGNGWCIIFLNPGPPALPYN